MTRSVRNVLVATLVALHSAVSLGGVGLHALPGVGHESGLRPLAKNDHSHGPGKSSHQASEDCTVCQFLALGQATSSLVAGPTFWPAAPAHPLPAPALVIPPTHTSSSPRAPPVAVLS